MSEAQTFLAQNYEWIVVKPIRIVLMLLAVLLLTFLVRRAIKRLARRLVSSDALAGTARGEDAPCEEQGKEGVRAGLMCPSLGGAPGAQRSEGKHPGYGPHQHGHHYHLVHNHPSHPG